MLVKEGFYQYKVGEKTYNKSLDKEYDGPFLFKVPKNDFIIRMILKQGFLYDKHNIVALWGFISKGDTVLDIGSNIGTMAIPFSKAVGKTGKVYAFEPQKFIYNYLLDNIKLNKCTNVIPCQCAVGHTNMDISLSSDTQDDKGNVVKLNYDSDNLINLAAVQLGLHGEKTKMISIDSLKLKKVTAIKIDVEGAEPLAFYGLQKTIKKFLPSIVYEKNLQKLSNDFLQQYNIPDKIGKFDALQFFADLGYDKLVELPRDNFIIIHPSRINENQNFNYAFDKEILVGSNKISVYKYIKPLWKKYK